MRISATIICRNEEELLPRCLDSLEGIDEIVVVDTGSTDGTLPMLWKRAAADPCYRILHYEWCDHFAAARNFCLDHASGDWCLAIDADEVLEEGGITGLRQAASSPRAPDTFRVRLTAEGRPGEVHYVVRAHRRVPGRIQWVGRIHETVSEDSLTVAPRCGITYGYSPAHSTDPDRSLRLLEKAYEEQSPPSSRTLYYLAREYWYRKDYERAAELFAERVDAPFARAFKAETADAFLYLARCLWALSNGDGARRAALEALHLNPNFKEAHLAMADMVWPHHKEAWLKFAEQADNSEVLFVRTP